MFKKARAAPTGEDAEVAIVDEYTCVYRTVNDLVAVVVGEGSENELLLEAALDAILSALEFLLKKGVVKAQVSAAAAIGHLTDRSRPHHNQASTPAPLSRAFVAAFSLARARRRCTSSCLACFCPSTRCWMRA